MGDGTEEREMQHVDMEVQDVEAIRLAVELIQHAHILEYRVVPLGGEPDGTGGARHKLGAGDESPEAKSVTS